MLLVKPDNTLEIIFLKHKRNRFNAEERNGSDIIDLSKDFKPKLTLKIIKFFESFKIFNELKHYCTLIEATYKEYKYSLSIFSIILYKHYFSLNLNKNCFDSINFNTNDIATNLSKNSLQTHIYDKIEKAWKEQKISNRIMIIGEKGIGKTSALMLYSLVLRINPYNIVLSIFDPDEFLENACKYFLKEALFSLYNIFKESPKLDLKDLYDLYKCEEVDFYVIFLKYIELIKKAINSFDSQITIIFILDNYDKYYNRNNPNKNMVVNIIKNIENVSLKYLVGYKFKLIISSNNLNNEIIVDNIANNLAEEELSNNLIFLNANEIFKINDFDCLFSDSYIKQYRDIIVSNACCNYFYIKHLINNYDYETLSKSQVIKEKLIDKVKLEFETNVLHSSYQEAFKAFILYSMSTYTNKIKEQEKHGGYYDCLFSSRVNEYFGYSNTNHKYIYKNFFYCYLYPFVQNGEVRLKLFNSLTRDFLKRLKVEPYFSRIKMEKITFDNYSTWYKITSDDMLKGRYLEELIYLFFKNANSIHNTFHKITRFDYLNISENSQDAKINNIRNLNMQHGCIHFNIKNVQKFNCSDNLDIITGDKLISLEDGIYFMSSDFPIFDAIIVNQDAKNLIMVQIKQTLTKKIFNEFMDYFQILFLLLENINIYQSLYRIFLTDRNDNLTKLEVLVKVAYFIHKGWSINLMFVHNKLQTELFQDKETQELLETDYVDPSKNDICFQLAGYNIPITPNAIVGSHSINESQLLVKRKRTLKNTLIVDANDFTANLNNKMLSDYITMH